VRRDRIEALTRAQRQGFPPFCPDAVFEIRSPSDSVDELRSKMLTYMSNGARLAVLIDPQRRAVELHAPGKPTQIIEHAQSVLCDPVFPGFTLEVESIFA
jgi:Uma2 family endonuclease